jgi:NADPH:quinone reductase-like Zn-dependent oxidoreductase
VRALRLFGDRDARLAEMEEPPPPGPGEIQLRMLAVALNHIDVWGWRGMAFAKRKLPMTIGAEAVGEVAAVGPGVEGWRVGQRAAPYGALTCGHCRACREGRDNLCENVAGVLGFHMDGFAQEKRNVQARLAVPVPEGVAVEDAACAAITFSTVEHMLFDNAKLEPGETILIQAGGSGIGTVAIKQAKALGCAVIATAGSDEKCARMRDELGADHAVNYNTDRFESVCRRPGSGWSRPAPASRCRTACARRWRR